MTQIPGLVQIQNVTFISLNSVTTMGGGIFTHAQNGVSAFKMFSALICHVNIASQVPPTLIAL